MTTQFRRNPARTCLADGWISRRSFPAGESIDNLSTKRWNPSTSSAGASTPRSVSREATPAAAGSTAGPARSCSTPHLRDQASAGCPMAEFQQVLPGQSRAQIRRLLDELRRSGQRVSWARVAGLAGVPAANPTSQAWAFRRATGSHRMSHRNPLTGRPVAWPHLPMFIRQARSREIRRTTISAC